MAISFMTSSMARLASNGGAMAPSGRAARPLTPETGRRRVPEDRVLGLEITIGSLAMGRQRIIT
jgi:hypothetical protein